MLSPPPLIVKSPLWCSPFYPFLKSRYPELAAICRDSRTLILYPGPKSENLEELVQREEIGTEKHNIIIIDGTWSQAKNMFLKNSLLHLPKQVHRCGAIWLEQRVVFMRFHELLRPKWIPLTCILVYQVQLNGTLSSQYVIRTQPSNICLSTLESAAYALSILEKNDSIQEVVKYLWIIVWMCLSYLLSLYEW